MLISVAIPAYNAAEYLREAIESVLAQTYRELEIVVVDDGSTDHTREVCASFGAAVRYFYIENDGTAGFGARYRSFRESRGEWIALLDQDDRWLPEKIERQVEAARRFADAGVIFTRYQLIDVRGEPLPTPNPIEARGGVFRLDSHEALHTLFRSNPFCPSSAIVRRSALDEIGEPDTQAAGDWDMWFRISRRSALVVIDEYLTEYRVSAEQFCSNKQHLADRMSRTLKRNQQLVRRTCAECRAAWREGQAHVANVFAVAARTYLDECHEAAHSGSTAAVLRLLWRAARTSPRETMRPRRLAAISKNYAAGIVQAVKGAGGARH